MRGGSFCSNLSFLFRFPFYPEELDAEAAGMQGQPGRAPAQEEALQGPQWPEPGPVQEQSPPPPPALRPGEQPPPGSQARQEEEEETPEQETPNGTSQLSI